MDELNKKILDNSRFKRECMGIVNQLFDLAEVSVEKRQAINDTADKYVQEQFLQLFNTMSDNAEFKKNNNLINKCSVCGHLSCLCRVPLGLFN